MDLTALTEKHERDAAQVSPVVFALLRALRVTADGKTWVEGDFREWLEEGEKLAGEAEQARAALGVTTPTPRFDWDAIRTPLGRPPRHTAPLTTGDDDRPFPPPAAPPTDRMAAARAARAAKAAMKGGA